MGLLICQTPRLVLVFCAKVGGGGGGGGGVPPPLISQVGCLYSGESRVQVVLGNLSHVSTLPVPSFGLCGRVAILRRR